MSKKMMLVALAVVSAAWFAIPAIAWAQEIHLEPGNGEAFEINGGPCEIRSETEATHTCEKIDGSGKFETGSSTTGTVNLDLTGCHISVFGITSKCHTAGSALDNTVALKGTFHLITWKNAAGSALPAILITLEPSTITAAGVSSLTITGNLIGTITSPVCGAFSKEVKFSFTATGTTQDHELYTGTLYDLKAYTDPEGPAHEKTAAFVGSFTWLFPNQQKLNCT
jgi:hypothetical protein